MRETAVTALSWVCIRHGHGMCLHNVCLPATVRDFVAVASDGQQSPIMAFIATARGASMTRKCADILTCWWISIHSQKISNTLPMIWKQPCPSKTNEHHRPQDLLGLLCALAHLHEMFANMGLLP